MLEKDIQRTIIEYLDILRNQGILMYMRLNTGAYKTQHGSFIKFGSPGAPDILVFKQGKTYGLEVKNEKGRLSQSQKEWSEEFMHHGFDYHIVRSLDDVMDIFNET